MVVYKRRTHDQQIGGSVAVIKAWSLQCRAVFLDKKFDIDSCTS